jgi:hypothetical protein
LVIEGAGLARDLIIVELFDEPRVADPAPVHPAAEPPALELERGFLDFFGRSRSGFAFLADFVFATFAGLPLAGTAAGVAATAAGAVATPPLNQQAPMPLRREYVPSLQRTPPLLCASSGAGARVSTSPTQTAA